MKHRRLKSPALAVALGFSLLMHLSMVTLFQIVIFFPKEDIEYFRFAIVDARENTLPTHEGREQLTLGGPGDPLAFAESLSGEGGNRMLSATLPPVMLPTLRFAELELLRVGVKGLQVRSKYEELFQEGPRDAWGKLGQKLNLVAHALARVTGAAFSSPTQRPMSVGRPAPGFEAYLEWMDEPRDRQPTSVSKIEALWGHDPADLRDPITLVFKVNRDGHVVYVLPKTAEDERGIVDGAALALLKYRFERITGEFPEFQHGTLLIHGEGRPE